MATFEIIATAQHKSNQQSFFRAPSHVSQLLIRLGLLFWCTSQILTRMISVIVSQDWLTIERQLIKMGTLLTFSPSDTTYDDTPPSFLVGVSGYPPSGKMTLAPILLEVISSTISTATSSKAGRLTITFIISQDDYFTS